MQEDGRYKELCAELQRDLERERGESHEHVRLLRVDVDAAKVGSPLVWQVHHVTCLVEG